LPEFYLRRFCRDRTLWIYDAELREIAPRFPETIAIKKNFYSIEGKKATEKYQAGIMLSELESITAPVIDRVDAGDRFSVRDKYYVSLFASLLKTTFHLTADEKARETIERVLDVCATVVQ
jgi:hypothetical protein